MYVIVAIQMNDSYESDDGKSVEEETDTQPSASGKFCMDQNNRWHSSTG